MNIEVCELSKSFGDTKALDRISFFLPEGAIVGFVGPNGAGKTTAIRIMAGLEQPDSGKVMLGNLNMIEYPDQVRAQIGFMPDSMPDSDVIRVWEYLDFYARAFGLRGQAKSSAINRVAEFTNLASLPDKMLSELSKGMKQQVSLARVLLHDPKILLLDEPAAGLDPRARIELRACLVKLAQEGKTIFISSHVLSDLDDIATGAVIIEKGKIVSHGKLTDLSASAAGEFCRIVLSLLELNEQILEQINGLELVESAIKSSNKQIMVKIKGGTANYHSAMVQIFMTGLPIIRTERPDAGIEEIFLKSTKGEVN